jgi:hypothetical protein
MWGVETADFESRIIRLRGRYLLGLMLGLS